MRFINSFKNSLFNVGSIRNSSAHNNCILLFGQLNTNEHQKETKDYLSDLNKQFSKNEFLNNKTINDFVTTLIVFNKLCKSQKMKFSFYADLEIFFNNRVLRNKNYYENNKLISSSFDFLHLVISSLKED